MKNLDQIAKDLFNKIRGRFAGVTIGDDEGNLTNDPMAARFYDFEFGESGNSIGSVSVALFDDKLSVIYYQDMIADADSQLTESWYAFLHDMRRFAKRRLLAFDTRNVTKTNLKRRDYQFLAQDTYISESMYGTVRKSYQKIGQAKLSIQHSKPINTESKTGRTHNIQSIFIESDNGERFRYPYRHLKGARAMARHVSEGGNPYDEFGKHLIGLSEELSKLNRFRRHLNRSRVMAEGLSEYSDAVADRVKAIHHDLHSAHTEHGYRNLVETFEKVILEQVPEPIELDWVDQLTIKQFNEELRDIFPYVYRLVSEHKRSLAITPDQILGDDELF